MHCYLMKLESSVLKLAMTMDHKCVLLNLETREAIAIPDDIRAAATELATA